MADPAIQYEDGGPDTSVPARPGLTGDPTGSVLDSVGARYDTPPSRDFMGDIDARASRASAGIAKAADDKLGRDSYLRQRYGAQLDEDRARMDRAFQMESKTADDPALTHPWNADKERADRIKGPLENFGSVGMIFALAASAFTKTPMTSALNAGAAAMNAMREGDELAYKSAYQAWKDNTELVKKRFDMERAVYDDANKLATTDLNAWRNQMEIAASQFGDEKLKVMAQNGMIPEVFQTLEARANSIEKAMKAVNDQTNFNLTSDLARDKLEQWKTENHPPPADAPNEQKLSYGLQMRVAEHKALLDAKKQVYESQHPTYGVGGLTSSKDQATRIVERTQQLIDSGEEKDPKAAHARAANEVQRADTQARESGKTKTDAAIVNTLDMYPGMSKEKLGYISPTIQPKLITALRDSPENLEAIAAYTKEHPRALGLIAEATKRVNLDAYQALFKNDPAAAKSKIAADRDAAIDQVAKDKKLDLTQAAEAKVLQKLLTTQAFTDAALAGSRGATIYLDKAFKEIYDPTSSPGAFFSILEKRYDEADRQSEKYKLGFDRRSEEALEKMPFWRGKAAGYAGTTVDSHTTTDSKGDKYRFIGTDYETQKRDKSKWEKIQ